MGRQSDQAVELFKSGFACSQAVLAAFCETYGLDRTTALMLSCGLGGGVKSADICGAVSGAVLVIGLKYGQQEASDKEARRLCSIKTGEFLDWFKASAGSVVCRDLLKCDISTPQGREQAQREKLFSTRCVELVARAAAILEESGY